MKTTYTYDHYYDYAELSSCLAYFKEHYPTIFHYESIAQTKEEKQVWAVTLSDSSLYPTDQKPAFYIDGNHHAGEVTGSMACLHFIDYICTNQDQPSIQKLLKEKTIYVIPKISPDGSDTYLHTPYKLRSLNQCAEDYKPKPGLYQEDIDQDSHIAMMRVPTCYGAWKKDEKDPFIMTKRLPDDVEGEFYDVYLEGMIHDYDGLHIQPAKPKWHLDFNRNYPYGWFAEARQPGAGKYPLSNIETKAVADFVLAHKNIGFALTMHTSGGVLVYPPGTMPEKKADPEDMRMFKEIGAMATKEMGYPVVNIFDAFLQDTENYSSGAFDDWMYHTQGIPTYTVELWDVKGHAGCPTQWPVQYDKSDAQKQEEFVKVVNWIKKHAPEGILPWKKVMHPQLGEVEVGGIDFKFTCQNCPKPYLLQEVEKTTKFILRNTFVLPQLHIAKKEVTALGNQLYKVELVVANKGYLPTYICEEAKKAEVNQPLTVEVKHATIVSSSKPVEELAGFFNTSTSYDYDSISTQPSKPIQEAFQWILQTDDIHAVEITIQGEKCGIQHIKLDA